MCAHESIERYCFLIPAKSYSGIDNLAGIEAVVSIKDFTFAKPPGKNALTGVEIEAEIARATKKIFIVAVFLSSV